MLFHPERVALAGLLVWLLLWLIAPLDQVFPLAWQPMAYMAAGYAGFWLGCLALSGRLKRVIAPQRRRQFGARAFWLVLLIGVAGMALRLYDKFFIRGIDLTVDAMESRELLADAEAGPLAAVGGVLYPFCYVPLMLWWARHRDSGLPGWARPLAIAAFVLPAVDALILLSRSQMLVALSMMYLSAACVLYQGQPLHARLVRPLLIGFTALLGISVAAFMSRLGQMDMDIIFSILNSAYGYVLTPNKTALLLIGENGLAGRALAALLPLSQYYLHGVYEFSLLWTRPDAQVFTLGTQHFAPYIKAASIFKLITYPDFGTYDIYYRTGVFTTFFGPLWADFAWGGPLFTMLLGMLAKRCGQWAREGRIAVMPLYAYLCVVVFFMPVVNLLVSAQGMYIVNAFVLVALLFGRHRRSAAPLPSAVAQGRA